MSRRVVASRNIPPEAVMRSFMETNCWDCDADYVLREDPEQDLIWHLDIAHDETCPKYLGIL